MNTGHMPATGRTINAESKYIIYIRFPKISVQIMSRWTGAQSKRHEDVKCHIASQKSNFSFTDC